MNCPDCGKNENTIKNGIRSTNKGTVQKYYCRSCQTHFSDSNKPYTQYPEHVILYIRKALPEDGRTQSCTP